MPKPLFPMERDMKRAVLYLRVSTEEQVSNYSLDTQLDICTKEAERRGMTVKQTFREEGKSAKTIKDRPALVEMLEYCRKHKKEIDAVIVYRLDRIARQTADYLAIRKKLIECEITLISASEPTGNSPTEKFVETMLAGFAQMDNDVRGERTRNGLRARLMNGLYNGVLPLGYIGQNGYPIKDPLAFDLMQESWKLLGTGTYSLRQIADFLNEHGVHERHRDGKEYPIRHQTLQRLFRNKYYMGKVVSHKYGIETEGQHPPMVTEEEFYRVQAVLDGRNTNLHAPVMKRTADNQEFPLRRIVKCSGCKQSFTGAWSKGKRGRYAYYFCHKRCGAGPSVPIKNLEDETNKLLTSITPTPKALELFIVMLRKTYTQRLSTLQKRRESADVELKKQYELRQAVIQNHLEGIYSNEIFKTQNQLIEDKIRSIVLTKDSDTISKYNLEAIATFVEEKFSNLCQTLEDSDLFQIRVLLCSIFPSGLVWQYPGYSNTDISPFWNLIEQPGSTCGTLGGSSGTRTQDTLLKRQVL